MFSLFLISAVFWLQWRFRRNVPSCFQLLISSRIENLICTACGNISALGPYSARSLDPASPHGVHGHKGVDYRNLLIWAQNRTLSYSLIYFNGRASHSSVKRVPGLPIVVLLLYRPRWKYIEYVPTISLPPFQWILQTRWSPHQYHSFKPHEGSCLVDLHVYLSIQTSTSYSPLHLCTKYYSQPRRLFHCSLSAGYSRSPLLDVLSRPRLYCQEHAQTGFILASHGDSSNTLGSPADDQGI